MPSPRGRLKRKHKHKRLSYGQQVLDAMAVLALAGALLPDAQRADRAARSDSWAGCLNGELLRELRYGIGDQVADIPQLLTLKPH